MKQTTKRFLSLAISFVLFTATLVVYFNLILPANDEQQAIKAQAIGRQNFVDSQKSAISQVTNMINSYKGEGELQDVVSSILPSSPDLAGAFSQISGLVQINKLLMERVAVSPPVNQNIPGAAGQGSIPQSFVRPVGSIDFQVKVAGTYEDLKSFLKNVETNIRVFDVKKIDMQSAAKSNQNFYTYDITITAYYQNNL